MERVTVQYNGEMVTLDVPEGMSDDQIFAFLQQQDQQKQSSITQITTEPSLGGVAEQVAGQTAAKAALFNPQMSVTSPAGPIRPTPVNPTVGGAVLQEAADLTKLAGQITPAGVRSFVEQPSKILQIPGAFFERYMGTANMNKSVGDLVKGTGQLLTNPQTYKNVAGKVGMMAMAPENILTAPYAMAAYERGRIRQDPTRPLTNKNPFTGNQVVVDTLEYNPYAQEVRGQFATQGQAGAANRRQAIASQQYGGLTQEQQRMLEQDRIDQAIRRKAASRVLGPIAPGM